VHCMHRYAKPRSYAERGCSAVSSCHLPPPPAAAICTHIAHSLVPLLTFFESMRTLILPRPRRQAPRAHLRQVDHQKYLPEHVLFDRHAMRGMCWTAPCSYLRQGQRRKRRRQIARRRLGVVRFDGAEVLGMQRKASQAYLPRMRGAWLVTEGLEGLRARATAELFCACRAAYSHRFILRTE
jgi:hypothetical protein